jgi:hypothetical protein
LKIDEKVPGIYPESSGIVPGRFLEHYSKILQSRVTISVNVTVPAIASQRDESIGDTVADD